MNHPYTALLCYAAGAALLALVATAAVTVLALRLDKVTRDRDRLHTRYTEALARLAATCRRVTDADWLAPHEGTPPVTRISWPLRERRPSLHFGDAELGAMVRDLPAIRLRSSTPTREG